MTCDLPQRPAHSSKCTRHSCPRRKHTEDKSPFWEAALRVGTQTYLSPAPCSFPFSSPGGGKHHLFARKTLWISTYSRKQALQQRQIEEQRKRKSTFRNIIAWRLLGEQTVAKRPTSQHRPGRWGKEEPTRDSKKPFFKVSWHCGPPTVKSKSETLKYKGFAMWNENTAQSQVF